jgi:hypothetical protein
MSSTFFIYIFAWQYENTKVKHHGANGRLTNNYRPLKNPLSSALVEVLKPVFEKLSSLQLLLAFPIFRLVKFAIKAIRSIIKMSNGKSSF